MEDCLPKSDLLPVTLVGVQGFEGTAPVELVAVVLVGEWAGRSPSFSASARDSSALGLGPGAGLDQAAGGAAPGAADQMLAGLATRGESPVDVSAAALM